MRTPFILVFIATMLFLIYNYFSSRLKTAEQRSSSLEDEVEDLQTQLDKSIQKEERSRKEANENRQVKETILSAMSHDVRTPLNGIMGMASLLENTTLTTEQLEYSRNIYLCGQSLLATVNDILATGLLSLSKSGDGEERGPDASPFNLRDCIEEVFQLFAAKTRPQGPELLYNIGSKVPDVILGDRRRLAQVLANLVENAVRHTTHGEIIISVYLTASSSGDKLDLGFEVRDTGAGIPASRIDHLFDGIAAAQDTGDDQQGQGLGLVIVRKLIESMGGSISVFSEPGKGSIFTFNILTAPGQRWSSGLIPANTGALEGRLVLVVDASPRRLTSRQQMLEQLGLTPIAAFSTEEAHQLVFHHPNIAAIITDTGFTGPNPNTFIGLIRSERPDVPIIISKHATEIMPGDISETTMTILDKPVKFHLFRDRLLDSVRTVSAVSVTTHGDNNAIHDEDNAIHTGFGATYADHDLLLARPSASTTKPATTPGTTKPATTPPPKTPQLIADTWPMRILVAEDNAVNQKIALKVLHLMGYQPSLATNGKEVLDHLAENTVDIVFMDVQMPEMDGIEATRMIRTCVSHQPLIIAMTANVMQGDRDECLQAGMDDYISKPLDFDHLALLLKKWGAVIKERIK